MIYRLIDRGISIEVGTKLHADGLEQRHDDEILELAREVQGTIESHMFQEVSQATLARFFQDGAYTLGNIEVGESRLLVVMTDVIRLQREGTDQGIVSSYKKTSLLNVNSADYSTATF